MVLDIDCLCPLQSPLIAQDTGANWESDLWPHILACAHASAPESDNPCRNTRRICTVHTATVIALRAASQILPRAEGSTWSAGTGTSKLSEIILQLQ